MGSMTGNLVHRGKQRQEVDFGDLGLAVGDRLWGGPYFGVLEYLEIGNSDVRAHELSR